MIGVILAGGRGRRFGGVDKPLLSIGQTTLLGRAVAVLRPQCETLVLNANGDPGRFAAYGLPVVGDDVEGHAGPLAGLVAALDHVAARYPSVKHVLTAPADAPFLPGDLAERFEDARLRSGVSIVSATSGGRDHPVVALWSLTLRHSLRHALTVDGIRRMRDVLAAHTAATVDWPCEPIDPFFNVNTPEDLETARRAAAEAG